MNTLASIARGPIAGRRQVLAGIACAGAFAATSPVSAAPALALTVPADRLRAYMLMRGALDDRLLISCISCQYFGVVNAAMTPFYDLVAATFSRFRPAPNGGYEGVSFEIEYFIDRDTGEVLDKWRNPYSGEIVTAKHNDSTPVKYVIGADTRMGLPPALLFPGSRVERALPRFDVTGPDIWVRENTTAIIPVAGAKSMNFNEIVSYHAKVDDLLKPGVTRLQADSEYIGVSSFRPWQAMGERQGNMIGYGIGGSGLAMSDLPPRWIAATKKLHPEALTNPGAYLDPLWNAA